MLEDAARFLKGLSNLQVSHTPTGARPSGALYTGAMVVVGRGSDMIRRGREWHQRTKHSELEGECRTGMARGWEDLS